MAVKTFDGKVILVRPASSEKTAPVQAPVNASARSIGRTTVVKALAAVVLPRTLTVVNPTGSVVAVVWPFTPVSKTDEAKAAAREKRVMFIQGKSTGLALVVKEFFGFVAKLSHLLISLIMCWLG